jgi:H+/Na+-translocating ferredoxin:NAD+ oxidoreductase subunit G
MAKIDGNAITTALVVGVFAAAAVFLARATYDWSHERVAVNQRARLVARLNSVLDPGLRDRDLTTTRLSRTDPTLLGSRTPVDVFVLSDHGQPVATVFASVAPHGYNAQIGLLIGVAANGTITGVRSVRHRETPGLGDAIDSAKSHWIEQFDATSLSRPARETWAVKQDEGQFDSITGATVTSRAVVGAVKNTLLYFEQHRDEIYRAAAEAAPDDNAPDL